MHACDGPSTRGLSVPCKPRPVTESVANKWDPARTIRNGFLRDRQKIRELNNIAQVQKLALSRDQDNYPPPKALACKNPNLLAKSGHYLHKFFHRDVHLGGKHNVPFKIDQAAGPFARISELKLSEISFKYPSHGDDGGGGSSGDGDGGVGGDDSKSGEYAWGWVGSR